MNATTSLFFAVICGSACLSAQSEIVAAETDERYPFLAPYTEFGEIERLHEWTIFEGIMVAGDPIQVIGGDFDCVAAYVYPRDMVYWSYLKSTKVASSGGFPFLDDSTRFSFPHHDKSIRDHLLRMALRVAGFHRISIWFPTLDVPTPEPYFR